MGTKKRKIRITRGEIILLIVIILIVFFLPDAYLMFRQRFLSQDLKIYKLSEIKYNLISQSYEPTQEDTTSSLQGEISQESQNQIQSEIQGENQTQEENIDQDQAQNQAQDENSQQENGDWNHLQQASDENGGDHAQKTNDSDKTDDAKKKNTENSNAQKEQADSISNFDQAKVVQLVEKKPTQEQVFVVNSQIAVISEEKLSAYSKDGEKKWEAQINAPEPYIISSKDYIYIINKQKGDIAKLNADNEITAVVQNLGKITRIKASDDYVVLSGSNPNEFSVLDKDLQAYSNFIIPNGDVVDFELSTDSKNVIVNTLHINKYKLESFILTYDIKGKIIGTADINQQIVYSMGLDENMIVVSDTALMSFDKNGSKSSEMPNAASLIDISSYREKVYTLSVSDEDSNITDVNVYSQFLDRLAKKELEQTKEGILANEKFCLIYDYASLELYDNRLNFISKLEIKENIDKIQWIDEYSFAIIGDGVVTIYEIR